METGLQYVPVTIGAVDCSNETGMMILSASGVLQPETTPENLGMEYISTSPQDPMLTPGINQGTPI